VVEDPAFEIVTGKKFLHSPDVHMGCAALTTSDPMGTRDTAVNVGDHSPPSRAEFKNEWINTSTPLRAFINV
jgi:hypothetical protein